MYGRRCLKTKPDSLLSRGIHMGSPEAVSTGYTRRPRPMEESECGIERNESGEEMGF